MSTDEKLIHKIIRILQLISVYFLSFVLIAFATAKFFNLQFQIYHYSGYVPLKEISLFTHAWSFLGRSYQYNLFLGIIEFIAGALLLFNRTRLMGLLIALGVYLNVLVIDFSFNVADAIGHAMLEFTLIILLLVPYLKHLKNFFWNMGGKFETATGPDKKMYSVYLPLGFLIICTAGFLLELSIAKEGQDKILGEYQLHHLVVNHDTVELRGGKYTPLPMLFFEFGNTLILSVNDSSYWADYQIREDSIHITFDKENHRIKSIEGVLDRKHGRILGSTDKHEQLFMSFTHPDRAER